MKNREVNTYRKLFAMIMLLLAIPLVQSKLKIFKTKPLKGYYVEAEKPELNFKTWFSEEYQMKQEKYLNEKFGFRSIFVRINHQIDYSLFNKAYAQGVIIGKEHYLYEENYIRAYYGTDFIGSDSIRHRIEKLKFLQDTLSKLGKNLIPIFAAGKGSYYPDYFPDDYLTEKGITNYETHVEFAQKNHLSYIDFNRYFLDKKQRTRYPLYPQFGIHWSVYGQCIAADSIITYIEKARNIDMPDIYWDKIKFGRPRKEDLDISEGMNLLFKPKTFKMAYPEIRFQADSGKTRPSILVIADSFYWGLFKLGFTKSFSVSHFWFYNRQIFPESFKAPWETNQIDLKEEIDRHDVIIILATEANLPDFGWGFIENACKIFSCNFTF